MSECDMKIYILAYPHTFTIAIVICPNVDRKFESFFKRFYGLLMNLARWNYHQLLDVYYIYKSRLFAYSSRKREATVYEEIVKVVSSDTNRLFTGIHLAPSGLFFNTWNVSGVLFYFVLLISIPHLRISYPALMDFLIFAASHIERFCFITWLSMLNRSSYLMDFIICFVIRFCASVYVFQNWCTR